MHVDTKTYGITVEIVDGVEMLEESVTDQEQVLVFTWESALVDNEVALLMGRLIQVLFWVNLENVVAHLETNWLNLGGNVLTGLLDVAESLVGGAVKVWQSLRPLGSDLFENIRWDGKLG